MAGLPVSADHRAGTRAANETYLIRILNTPGLDSVFKHLHLLPQKVIIATEDTQPHLGYQDTTYLLSCAFLIPLDGQASKLLLEHPET